MIKESEIEIRSLLVELQTPSFAVPVNMAAGFRAARAIISNHPTVRRLVFLCDKHRNFLSFVMREIERLALISVDMRYESPWDSALAAMLTILEQVDRASAELTALLVRRAPQTWWARQMANELLKPSKIDSETGLQVVNVPTIGDKAEVLLINTFVSLDQSSDWLGFVELTSPHHGWPKVSWLVKRDVSRAGTSNIDQPFNGTVLSAPIIASNKSTGSQDFTRNAA